MQEAFCILINFTWWYFDLNTSSTTAHVHLACCTMQQTTCKKNVLNKKQLYVEADSDNNHKLVLMHLPWSAHSVYQMDNSQSPLYYRYIQLQYVYHYRKKLKEKYNSLVSR